MATVHIDGVAHEVERGQNLLHICLTLRINLPYFCWHPALGSVGACRQCAIKQFRDKDDTRGRIVMACMTPADDNMFISVADKEAQEFRRSVIEWLMVNHPHDCPVCDEGGECHLQDMTVMTGHNYREFRFAKRTHNNQYLGPFVNHEMNRCIACYRCVRFYRDYAGGRDLDVFGAHDNVYFGRAADGVLENEFSGNLAEVCPTGVFTDKTLGKHYVRKWDLQTAPSICVHCGTGCNIIAGERYGTLRRIRNRYNYELNGYFLCDRGRFGYEFVNSVNRIRQPVVRSEAARDAVDVAAELIRDNKNIIGIGSPRASLEANFALRTLVGADRFFSGISESEARCLERIAEILRRGPAPPPSLRQVEKCDAVFVLGEDVTNTAPRLALSLRQAARRKPSEAAQKLIKVPAWNDAAIREVVQGQHGPLFVATPYATRLDDIATRTYFAAPADLARLGFAVAHLLNGDAPAVDGLSEEVTRLAELIAAALRDAECPVIISGSGCGDEAVIQAAANVAFALRATGGKAELCLTVPECNSLGLQLMNARPLKEGLASPAETVVVLENDLYRRANGADVDRFFVAAKNLIVLDHLENRTSEKARIVFPAATFAESDGTLVNYETRAQRFYSVFAAKDEIRESWRWLRDIGIAAEKFPPGTWPNFDAISGALAEALPVFKPITEAAPPADFRIAGQKIPREPHRYSGRTAMHASVDVSEPNPLKDPDSALNYSMEGYSGQPPPPLIPFFWSPGWNSIQSLTRFQEEAGGQLHGGTPGKHLLDGFVRDEGHEYFHDIPPGFLRGEGRWLVVPIHHIFGSEELSSRYGAIAELAAKPYIALNGEDAAELHAIPGGEVSVNLCGAKYRLPVRVAPTLARGVAGIPAGVDGFSGMVLPAWAKIEPAEVHESAARVAG
jgi:NADH-quinone oxidoreductase subunit G